MKPANSKAIKPKKKNLSGTKNNDNTLIYIGAAGILALIAWAYFASEATKNQL